MYQVNKHRTILLNEYCRFFLLIFFKFQFKREMNSSVQKRWQNKSLDLGALRSRTPGPRTELQPHPGPRTSSSRTLVQAPGYMHEKTTHKAPRPMQNYFDLLLLFRRPLSTFYFFETLVHLKSFEKIWPGFLSNLWPRVRPRIWSRVWH